MANEPTPTHGVMEGKGAYNKLRRSVFSETSWRPVSNGVWRAIRQRRTPSCRVSFLRSEIDGLGKVCRATGELEHPSPVARLSSLPCDITHR